MAVDHEPHHERTALLNPRRRAGIPLRPRRRRLPSVRLGRNERPRRGVAALAGMLRTIRVRAWLRLRYARMVRKLKDYYRSLAKDLAEASATIEAFQNRLLVEASLAVPVMGLAFSGYPNPATAAGSDHRARTLAV